MEEQKNWLQEEVEELKQSAFDGERKPALKLVENKITEITVDFSEPFQKWVDSESQVVKKIIPCKVGTEEFVFWLNTRNPLYHQIVEKGAEGQTTFKVLQTGNQQNTRYTLVD